MALVFVAIASVVYALAESPRLGGGKLAQADALITAENLQQATNVLATIKPTDPEFLASGFYKALAFQKLGDYHRFLEMMSALSTNRAYVPTDLKEYLAFKQIEALYQFRRFEELLPKTRAFPQGYPASTHLPAVAEYQMAVLFERGYKNAYDTRNLKNEQQLNRRWSEAATNL